MAPPTGWGRPEHVYQCWCGRALLPAHPSSHPRQGPHWVLRPSLAQPQLQGLLRPVAAQDPSCPTAWPAPSASAAPAHTAQTRLLKRLAPDWVPSGPHPPTPHTLPILHSGVLARHQHSVTCASCVPPRLLAWLPWACSALWELNISGVSALKAFQGAGCPLASAPPNGPPHHGCAHAGAAGRSGGLVAGRGSGFRVQGGPSGCRGSDEGDAC